MQGIRACCRFDFSRRVGGTSFGQFAIFSLALLFGASATGLAQSTESPGDVSVTRVFPSIEIAELQPTLVASVEADAPLPDAPEPQKQDQKQNQENPDGKPLVTAAGPTTTVPATTNLPLAPKYSRVIPEGMATPQIHKWDKIQLAGRDLYSVTNMASWVLSAGWSHMLNGQPNYGTDSGAFGQRLGAAAVRDSSQSFLANGIFAVWLHQDPRYFALGRRHKLLNRAWYAVTRAVVTRDSTDGHAEFNTSLILGQAAGTALNNLYYPKSNRNFHDNISSFGGSVGGAALGFALDEFTSDLLRIVRMRRLERILH